MGRPRPHKPRRDPEQLSGAGRSGLVGISELSLSVLKWEQSWGGWGEVAGNWELGRPGSLLLPCCEAWSKTRSSRVQDPALPSHGRRRVLLPGFGVRGRGRVLTFNRPNSQARSRGVFFALLMRQGLDWCCSSISDTS